VQGQQINLKGTAYFNVSHRPGRTLNIVAADFELTDIGTRFSVENEPQILSVEVAEGSLAIRSNRLVKPVSLSTGQEFAADRSGQKIRLSAIDPALVGTWRTGKLQFDNAPLTLVAQEISRYSGEKVTVDPKIANQPFSGVIAINHGEAPAQSLAQILSLEVKTVDGVMRLQPRRK
jgi:transmembrane sensor